MAKCNMIYVADLIGDTGNEDATLLSTILSAYLTRYKGVTISFKDIQCVTARFVSTGLLSLLDDHSYENITKFIGIIDSNRIINDVILKMFKFEVKKSNELGNKHDGI